MGLGCVVMGIPIFSFFTSTCVYLDVFFLFLYFTVHVKRSRRRWFSVWEMRSIRFGRRIIGHGIIGVSTLVELFLFFCVSYIFSYFFLFFRVSSHFLCYDVT